MTKKKTTKKNTLGGHGPSGYKNFGEKDIHDAVYKLMGGAVTHKQLTDTVNAYWQVIQEEVKKGKNVQIFCVGSLRVTKAAKRQYKVTNPITGKVSSGTTSGKTVKFVLSDAFKKEIL